MLGNNTFKNKFSYRPKSLELFGRNRITFSLWEETLAGVTVSLIALPLALALGISSIPAGLETPMPVPTTADRNVFNGMLFRPIPTIRQCDHDCPQLPSLQSGIGSSGAMSSPSQFATPLV